MVLQHMENLTNRYINSTLGTAAGIDVPIRDQETADVGARHSERRNITVCIWRPHSCWPRVHFSVSVIRQPGNRFRSPVTA